MRFKLIVVVMLTLLLMSMSTLMFKIQPVEASPEETVVHYKTSHIVNVIACMHDLPLRSRLDSFRSCDCVSLHPQQKSKVHQATHSLAPQ